MRYLLTTDPGLEEVAAEELEELAPRSRVAPSVGTGRLRVDAERLDFARLRTIHHVAVVRAEADIASLGDARRAAAACEVPELADARSFRVTAHRRGDHPFRSAELAGAVGAGLLQRHATPVDLEDFAVEVRADLQDSVLVLSVQLTRLPLSKRLRRGRALRASLKPTLAAAMVRLAGAHRGPGTFLDPTCGAGTLPVEAKEVNPELVACASDWDEDTVAAARRTARNHGVEVDLRLGDARRLTECWDRRFTHVALNPPYGHRVGRRLSLTSFHGALLRSILQVVGGDARVVVITPRRTSFLRAVGELPFDRLKEVGVEAGGLRPSIHVLAPR